ncbi:MAG: hypothetical protein QM802_16275 [Agriterribacter sp.]
MTQDELQNIITKLESQIAKDNATFGIFQYGGDSDESYIQADKNGLNLFALELLKAAHNAGKTSNSKEEGIIPISFQENWFDEKSETIIHYVEIVKERNIRIGRKGDKESIAEKLLPYGCLIGLALIIVAFFVGLWTLVKWIF